MHLAFVVCCTVLAAAPGGYTVLGDSFAGTNPHALVKASLTDLAHSQLDAWEMRYEAVKTPEDCAAYQAAGKAFFLEHIGGLPERTPLNAQVTRSGEKDLFRYENVIFESQPGIRVTAVLYLPKSAPPYPAVLIPCGHDTNGKECEAYQRVAILLAMNGMAAFCFDPSGQGERMSYFDANRKPILATTLHHTTEGVGAILTGACMARYFIWDGMRAIDYLQSRADIDGQRIGCTGNSGGGTQTSYFMALDERIQCAAPSCYITSFRRLLDTIGPQDAEQNVFGQLSSLNQSGYIHLRAPKPTLLCTATRDFFDIAGSWDSFRHAKRFYTRLGFAERVDLIEADDEHGFTKPRREAAARWMSRWLLGVDTPIVEPEFAVLSAEEVRCSPEGQVAWMDGARTVTDLSAERDDALRPKREAFWRHASREEQAAKVCEALAVRAAAALPKIQAEISGDADCAFAHAEKLILHTDENMALPAIRFTPKDAAPSGWRLYCDPEGKTAHLDVIEAWVKAGMGVLSVDLRGYGELASDDPSHGWEKTVNKDWSLFFLAYLDGKTLTGLRTEDILMCGRYLSETAGGPVELFAMGDACIPALHAAWLEGACFKQLSLEDGIPSWSAVVHERWAKGQLSSSVQNVLAWYDLPDLLDSLQGMPVETKEMAVPTFN